MEQLLNWLSPYTQILLIIGVFCYAITQFALERARRQWKGRFQEEKARREAAEEANKAKAFFLSSMSHEIRAPLNAIVGFTDLALRTPLNPELREYLTTVRSSADWLSHVVNEVVEFSRIESGRLELTTETFSLAGIVNSAVNIAKPLAEQKKLSLQVHLDADVPGLVCGDGTRLLQVLFNLVENALKFTTAGGVLVTVALEGSGWDYATFGIAVADTGIGIGPGRVQHLFEPLKAHFVDLDRRARTCGFGLPICQRIVQSMGGEIEVQSRPGMGSRFAFSVTFPVVAEKTAAGQISKSAVTNKPKRLSILVAEADAERHRLTTVLLRGAGHIVTDAREGLDTVRLFTAGNFELVLLGGDMPDMDIFSMIKAIRSTEPEGRKVPIYALSQPLEQADSTLKRQKVAEAGGTGCLSEPFSMEGLLSLTTAIAAAGDGSLKTGVTDAVGKSLDGGAVLNLVSSEAV